jgi:Zn-dependent peptidase ImmA (M78 family)
MLESRKREIRKAAVSFREKCTENRYGILNLFNDCKRCGYKLIRYPLNDNSTLGFATKRDDDIILFTNSCSRLSRELFTLAHEIGHAILHLSDTDYFFDNNNTIVDRNTDEKEQEANYFAACLLMPEDKVVQFIDLELLGFENGDLSALDIARIMSEFNVSFDMVLNRLESLHKINPNQKLRLNTERTEKRVSNLLYSVGGNAKLNISGNEVDIPYEYIDYVIYNYNHNAIPQKTLERVLAYYKLTLEDISDKLIVHTKEEDNLDDLIGGLDD